MDLTYWHWLAYVSAFFVVVEKVVPWHQPHRTLRAGWLRDLGFLAINGHFFYAFVFAGLVLFLKERGLTLDGIEGISGGWQPWVQFLAFFVVSDFIQWCTHVALHKVPFLWAFHKVHHSIPRLDWAANFHFHWMEICVYTITQAVPLAFLGVPCEVAFWVYVSSTFWGHFNHSNTPIKIGPLRYVFNSPQMHIWHHDASDEGGVSKNYGIVLSLWDWIFRTVHWPENREPERLGYPDDDEMPQTFGGQVLWPLTRLRALRFFHSSR